MALASWPARQGQQRSLRRIGQALSWAFARSPEARSFACALFASYVPDTASGRRSGDRHQIRVPVAGRVAVSERLTVSSPVYAACSLHVWTFIDAHGTAGADF